MKCCGFEVFVSKSPFPLKNGEIEIIGEFFGVEGLLVVVHDVGEIGGGSVADFGKCVSVIILFEVVLGAMVLLFRENLFLRYHPMVPL